MSRAVRERVWGVMEEWWQAEDEKAVLMTWPDTKLAGGQHVRTLGLPRQNLESHHGVFLACREIDDATMSQIEEASSPQPGPHRLEEADVD